MGKNLQTILVTGATGRQGGAVVDALLSDEFAGDFDDLTVRGLTRDAGSDAARRLTERGVDVVEGDTLDRDSLFAAMEDVDAVFGVTTFFEVGAEREREQGENLVAAAETAAVVSEHTGHDVDPVGLDVETVREAAGDEFADTFAWFNETGYDADVTAVERRLGIEMYGLEDCLDETAFLPRASPAA